MLRQLHSSSQLAETVSGAPPDILHCLYKAPGYENVINLCEREGGITKNHVVPFHTGN
jgi:hypothetical protein